MRASRWITLALLAAMTVMLLASFPRSSSLPGGYTYTYCPCGGHRYIIAPGGIKKVGQEVLDYHVSGMVVTGTVRLQLEHDDIRSFHLDLKTHQVTLEDRDQRMNSDPPRHPKLIARQGSFRTLLAGPD